MTNKEALIATKNLILNKENWTQYRLHNRDDRPELNKIQFCVRGALIEVCNRDYDSDTWNQYNFLDKQLLIKSKEIYRLHHVDVNNVIGHEAVHKILDAVIEETVD